MEAVKIQPPVVHTTVPRHLGSSGNGGGCALRQGRPMEIPPPPAREHTASLPATSHGQHRPHQGPKAGRRRGRATAGPWESSGKLSSGPLPPPPLPWDLPFLLSLGVLLGTGEEARGPAGARPVLTHRCTSDRLSAGSTSGGSHTWGPCPCPHSYAGSLRSHSYRLLVRPKVYTRVYKQNNNKNS